MVVLGLGLGSAHGVVVRVAEIVRREGGDEEHPALLLPEDTDGAQELFRTLGRQIRILRERAGLSRKQLGERLGYSEDTVSSVERGRRTPQPELLEAADELLGAGGLLATAGEEVKLAKTKARVKHPTWFRDYARLEQVADELCYYDNHVITGLFQTEEHARALFEMRRPLLASETINQWVAARMERQEILTRWPPPMITYVIEEAVLRRPIGGWEVHARQLEELLRCARLRNTELQVMLTERSEHACLGGPFALLTPRRQPQLAYLEVQNEGRLVTDAESVRILAARFSSIRGQALTPTESLVMIEKLLGER